MPNKLDSADHKNVIMRDFVDSTMKSASVSEESKAEKETIHSGQFMVSHFEAEEAMDDLDDGEVKMLDPEDPSLLKPDEPNACLQVQLYVPRKTCQTKKVENSMAGLLTSHLEIETSLTKLFKCMNLAYSQKLTSPKWNHFKGVRLRWKDKIRLNNVIWRCWHMQFILKRKTPVCQFASPLDADVHSNPQSVVLEGKYWKRQLTVIKAEYRKWRRNYISKTAGCLSYDNKSEFDFLEWSPINERNFFPTDEWTSDILFSSINVPFPFPDPREIARSAGIADFIQPSLGPLQPNLDDIDLTFADLLQNARLPPVPEEVSDDMLKNVEYGFSAIMGPDQMDSSTIMEVVSNNINQSNDDANMLELNSPLNTDQFNDVEQQFVSRGINFLSESTAFPEVCVGDTVMMDQRLGTQHSISKSAKLFGVMNDALFSRNAHEFPGKSVIKGRISKNFQRPFRRELHNYDKAQPTPHQTTVYQQMLAEQQKQESSQLLSHNLNIQHHKSLQTFQESIQLQFALPQNPRSSSTTITNNIHRSSDNSRPVDNDNSTSLHEISLTNTTANNNVKKFGLSEYMTNLAAQKPSTSHPLMIKQKLEPISSDKLSMLKSTYEIYGNKSQSSEAPGLTSYNPTQIIKKCAPPESFLGTRSIDDNPDQSLTQSHTQINSQAFTLSLNSLYPSSLSPNLSTSSQQKHQQKKKVNTQKEMFRSNSLPLNVCLHRMNNDSFVASKFQIKSNKSRSRSNSIHQHTISNNLSNTTHLPKQIQPAASEPLLNSTLAQLLTTSTPKISLGKHSCSPDNSLTTFNVPLTRSELRSAEESLTTLNSSSISGINKQQSTQPKLQQPRLKSQVNSVSIPMSAANIILHSPRENKVQTGSFTCEKNYSLSSESFLDQKTIVLSDQNRITSTDNQRRAGHIHAEQKRRYNIKNCFDMLHALIPFLQHNSSLKLSKAAMLQKGADHIQFLRSESIILNETIHKLREERDALNNSLSHLHTILPVNGSPLSRQGTEHVMQLYEQYVRYRTISHWKFWILGLMLEPLLTTFTSSVSSASMEEMRRTAYLWIDQHCSLIDLRPAVSNKLKYLSMNTDILSDPPTTLHEEVKKAMNSVSGQHPNLHG